MGLVAELMRYMRKYVAAFATAVRAVATLIDVVPLGDGERRLLPINAVSDGLHETIAVPGSRS